MPVIDFPFNEGVDETADRILAPDDRVRVLNNCRLARDGRIEVRRGHTAVSMTDINTFTVVPRELYTFRDTLLATDVSCARLRAYLPSYTPGAWTFGSGVRDLPAFGDLEKLADIPYGRSPRSWDVAAFVSSGVRFVALTYTDESTDIAYLHIYRDGIEVLFTFEASVTSDARVIATGTTFRWLYIIAAGIQHRSITPVTSLTVSAATQLAAQVPSFAWGATVEAATTNWAIAYSHSGGSMVWRSFTGTTQIATNSQVVQRPCNLAYTNNTIALVWTAGNDLLGRSYNATTNAAIAATQTLDTGGMTTQPLIVADALTTVRVACVAAAGLGQADFTTTFTGSVPVATMVSPSGADCVSTWWHSNLFAFPDTLLGTGIAGLGYVFSASISRGGSTVFPGTFAIFSQQSNIGGALFRTEATLNRGFTPRFLAGVEEAGYPSVASDGEWYYGVVPTQTGEHIGTATVDGLSLYRWRAHTAVATSPRIPAVEFQGSLYGAGAQPWAFGGARPADLGFADAPRILTIVQAATGSMTLLGNYNFIACYVYFDERGQLHRSQPSSPFAVTMTGANNSCTVTVTSPHSPKAGGGAVELYRTIPDDGIMFLVQTIKTPINKWESVVFTSGEADTAIQTAPVLYTQSQTPDAHFPPQPCKYLACGRDRIIRGGLPDPFMVQLSKLPFPGEPINDGSPNAFKFQARVDEPVTGVATMGDTYLVFTADAIYEIPGNGPQRNGQGEFNYPRALYSDGGCINHLSICGCAEGLWFQEAPDKLSLFDGASVVWAGQPIRDTLKAFPTITGSALCTETQTVVFACVNTANTDGVLLNYDLRRKLWTVDPVGAVQAVVEYDGRLAYILASVVRLEDAEVASGAMPTMSVRTASIRVFKAMGRGDLFKVGLLGTYRGDCSVQAYISYDDGLNWTAIGAAQSITSTDYAVDAPVSLLFDPPIHDVDRFALRFDVSGGSNTGAIRLHTFSVEVESQDFLTRRPARDLR